MPYNVNRHPVSHAVMPESNEDDSDPATPGAANRNPALGPNVLTSADSVRVGDLVDVLDSVQVWAEAEVLKVDRQLGNVFVTYRNWDNSWDEWIRVGDRRIAKLHAYTYTEGKPFQIGQRIEARDTRNVWLEAFIADMDHNRIFVHYKGWSMKFDEWLDMHDLSRIRPFGRSKCGLQIKRKEGRLFKVPQYDGGNGSSDHNAAQARPSQPCDGSSSRGKHADRDQESPQHSEYRRRIAESSAQYNRYKASLQHQDLEVVPVLGDGNCLFRSVAHQVYGDEELHGLVREKCMDYMEINAPFFSQFIEGGMATFPLYIKAKRNTSCWGDDPEIQSMCELYNRPADIWAYDHQHGARKLRTFHEAANSQGSETLSCRPSMRLSYYGGGHYDSIISGGGKGSVVLRAAPGEVEDSRMALIRRLGQSAGGGQLEDAKRETDREETERVTLELALQCSRAEHLRWAEEDLESCLINSFATIHIDRIDHLGSSSSKRELEDGVDAAPTRGEHKEGKCAKLGRADLALAQSELLSIEQDLLEGALRASMADAKPTREDRSTKDGYIADDDKGDSDLKRTLSLSCEDDLQAAIDASMLTGGEAGGDDASLLEALQRSMSEYGAGDEEEDLVRAIEMSLRE